MGFEPLGVELTLSSGEIILLPKLTLRKIIMITSSIANLFKAAKKVAPSLFDQKTYADKSVDEVGLLLIQALPETLPGVMDEVVQVLARYLGKENDWILDKLDLTDMLGIVRPLFANILKQSNGLFDIIGTLSPQPSPEPSSKSKENSK